MVLSLLTPTGPVTTVPGHGVIAVRLADYVGPARGDLSVVSDSLSVAGNVVKEEQEIAVQSTFTSVDTRYGTVSDTVVIPMADFGMDPLLYYNLLISMRMEGEAPSTAWANRTWASYQSLQSASLGWGFGQGTTLHGWANFVAREQFFPQYHIYDQFTWSNFGSGDFKIRGWGVTGGNVAMYFDMLYLIPVDGRGAAPDWYFNDFKTYYPDEPFDLMDLDTNGVVDPDQDNDTASVPWLGKHSCMTQGFPFTDQDTTNDYQESEDEMSTSNVSGFGQWDGSGDPPYDDIPDPPSWFAAVVGSTYATPHNILTEPFSQAQWSNPWISPQGYAWGGSSNLGGIYEPGNLFPGWYANAGTAICYIADYFTNTQHAVLRCGSFTGSGSNPQTYPPISRHLENRIMQCKLRFNTVWRGSLGIGLTRESINNSVQELTVGADCQLSAAGSLDLRLFSYRGEAQTAGVSSYDGTVTFSSPTTVNITGSYSAGDWFWVKVERRGYAWRAKAWMDGGSEPGSWQVEGQEPLFSRNTAGSVVQPIVYPYDTNWIAAGADADLVRFDPRLRGGTQIPTSTFFPTMAIHLFIGDPTTNQVNMTVEADDMTVDYDAGGTTPADYNFKLDKYDATPMDAAISIPYGSDRVVLGNSRVRSFNLDEDGYNPWIWKDGGDIPLQASGMYVFFERRRNGFFPEYGDITFP